MVARGVGVGGMGEKGEGIKKYKLVVTKQSWSCKIQHREKSSQRTYIHDPWTWRTVWGLPEGVGGGDRGGAKNGTTIIA